jgi:squalene-associated FAD-dependent desaturase
MRTHVIIVGGGVSGLAAGVLLTARGIMVTVLEQKPALGGRAYSFTDAATGETVDNGQHVMLAGYHRTMRFLETIGTRELVSVQRTPALLFHHPTRGFGELRLPPLPSPLHFTCGVLGFSLLSMGDRLRLLRAGLALLRLNPENTRLTGITVGEWLDTVGQSTESRKSFWEPLAVSIMNEHIGRASAEVFVRTLRTAFLGDRHDAALAIPRVGLSALYADGAQRYIVRGGGKVLCGVDVDHVDVRDGRAMGIRLRGDTPVRADAVILAVPPHKVLPLLADTSLAREVADLALLQSSPIVSIHLWYEREWMKHEVVGVIGRRIQWIFNRRLISNEAGRGGHISAVISAAYDLVGRTNEEITTIAVEDLKSIYPDADEKPQKSVVIREKRATYSSSPPTERFRPPHTTSIPNMFLAGDWIRTGLPATIEGAVVSAELCVGSLVNLVEFRP